MDIKNTNYNDLKNHYNEVLNKDKSLIKTTNDEPTPIECIEEMVSKLDIDWSKDLKILDPCCGCGNFFLVIYNELKKYHSHKDILKDILVFNDINEDRLDVVRRIYSGGNILNQDFLEMDNAVKYDLIVANPPYAKLLENGKRASKNHNLIGLFIKKTLQLLKPRGYFLFITPDNWMSLADRNTLIEVLTGRQIHHLNIHLAKKYFKKIGSSFTWYIIQNVDMYKPISVHGIYNKLEYRDEVSSEKRSYIPLYYNSHIQNILHKTLDNENLKKFVIETSSDLHRYTKRDIISKDLKGDYHHKLIHTPSQIVYANRPHKFQDIWKVFIPTTSTYKPFIDQCGMTQSIAFIQCKDQEQATRYCKTLTHPLYVFLNNICRWGNFNNVRILQLFPYCKKYKYVYTRFNISEDEIKLIESTLGIF